MAEDKIDRDVKAGAMLLLQGLITLMVTVSLGLQGWQLLSIHTLSIQSEATRVQVEANRKAAEDDIDANKKLADLAITAANDMIEKIVVFNRSQRDKVQDLEVRVKVLEERPRPRHAVWPVPENMILADWTRPK